MKKSKLFLLLFFCITLINNSFSQNNALDERNGFKDFTLGDSYSEWSSDLTYTHTADANIKYYNYIGNCCQQIFNYDLARIRLGFKDDKLQVIYLTTENFSTTNTVYNGTGDYDRLKNHLINLFREPVDPDTSHDNGNISTGWLGKRVILTLEYEYLGVQQDGDDFWIGDRGNILIGVIQNVSDGF